MQNNVFVVEIGDLSRSIKEKIAHSQIGQTIELVTDDTGLFREPKGVPGEKAIKFVLSPQDIELASDLVAVE